MTDDLATELIELAATPWVNSQARVACRSAAAEIDRLRAQIAEALDYEWRGDNFDQKHIRAILEGDLSRGLQGAAEPMFPSALADWNSPEDAVYDADPWTDPEPYIAGTNGVRHAHWDPVCCGEPCQHAPRTREQFDAEQEANRG